MSYRWIITKAYHPDMLDCVGIEGPYDLDPAITDNKVAFEMYDDDGNLYVEGELFGFHDGFEPLDDYRMPALGCTMIKIDGEWL